MKPTLVSCGTVDKLPVPGHLAPGKNTKETKMTNPTFTITARGEETTFTSAFATNGEAYAALAAQADNGNFAIDLLTAARARKLTPNRVAWMHKLATDAQKPASHRFLVEGLNLAKIIELFDNAFEAGKKFPKIVLAVAFDDDRTEVSARIVRCGPRSKYEGAATIKTANDEFAGRINRDGTVARGAAHAWADVEQVIRDLAADPLAVLAQNGIATGQCCYCARALSNAASREVGYGPICADKYGLPWGSKKGVDAASEAAKVVVRTKLPEITTRPVTVEDITKPDPRLADLD